MSGLFKFAKKLFFWMIWTCVVVAVGGSIVMYLYKDDIINHVVGEANKYLKTPVEVGKLDMNAWEKFPRVAISLTDVYIEESWIRSKDPLVVADKIFVMVDPIGLLRGNLEINEIQVSGASIYLKRNREGIPNYEIIGKSEGESSDSVTFNLEKVKLIDTEVVYHDFKSNQQHTYRAVDELARMSLAGDSITIDASGQIQIEQIRVANEQYVTNKLVDNEVHLVIYNKSGFLKISDTELSWDNTMFRPAGVVNWGRETVDLVVQSERTTIKALSGLLPGKVNERLKEYETRGDIAFDLHLTGNYTSGLQAAAKFNAQNASITHPPSNLLIASLGASGQLNFPNIKANTAYQLSIPSVSGDVGGRHISGSLAYDTRSAPQLTFDLTGSLAVQDLATLIHSEYIEEASGAINGNLAFDGNTNDLSSLQTMSRVKASANLTFDEVRVKWKDDYPPETAVSGNFTYDVNNLNIQNASISMGASSWKMTGSFKNILPYLISDDEVLRVEASIDEGYANLDEFLRPSDQPSNMRFYISDKLNIDLRTNMHGIRFDRFEARNIQGEVKINDQLAYIKNLYFESMGGRITLSSLINTKNDLIRINNTTRLEDIEIDSVFYVYRDFGQDWLKSENLKGSVKADVLTDMVFDQQLKFYSDSLISDISIAIARGQLLDFEPMGRLERYVGGEDLSKLSFSDIANDIHIEDRSIFIPNMEVQSNVTQLQISGTHTFDQHIAYQVVVPMKTMQKRNEEMFGAVKDDGSGSKLYLLITGTTTDYKVEYDTRAVGQKILTDLKKEVKELKDAFKKKEETREEITLNEEEYFEWEEDTTRLPIPRWPY